MFGTTPRSPCVDVVLQCEVADFREERLCFDVEVLHGFKQAVKARGKEALPQWRRA
jgi:hypothetical protein